jgi:SAM-dependent methyltransferase
VTDEAPPLGLPEIVAAAGRAASALDVGCGSGRLTVELARAGARVTGIDTHAGRLADAGRRAAAAGLAVRLLEADMDAPLPFADGAFEAATSRLALMIAADPAATLRELRRVLAPGGRIATALWASPERNPWFVEPRAAVADALGAERARFARAFGRLGDPAELARLHAAAGFADVASAIVADTLRPASAGAQWDFLRERIGHFRRLDAELADGERERLMAALERRLAAFRAGDGLELPRTIVLVTGRAP